MGWTISGGRSQEQRLHGAYSPWKRSVRLRKCDLILAKIIPFYTLEWISNRILFSVLPWEALPVNNLVYVTCPLCWTAQNRGLFFCQPTSFPLKGS